MHRGGFGDQHAHTARHTSRHAHQARVWRGKHCGVNSCVVAGAAWRVLLLSESAPTLDVASIPRLLRAYGRGGPQWASGIGGDCELRGIASTSCWRYSRPFRRLHRGRRCNGEYAMANHFQHPSRKDLDEHILSVLLSPPILTLCGTLFLIVVIPRGQAIVAGCPLR